MLWGAKQAFLDPKLYMFIILQMALITAQSFNNFFPSIVGTLGYNDTVTLLLTAPPYGFAFFCSLAISFHAAHKQERGLHIAVPLIFALLGNLMVCAIRLSELALFLTNSGNVHSHYRWKILQHVPHDSRRILAIQSLCVVAKLDSSSTKSKACERISCCQFDGCRCCTFLYFLHVS